SNPLLLLLLLLALPLLWMLKGDSAGLTLGYGEFKQVIQAPGVRLRKVKVSPNEIRGEMIWQDHVSGADAKNEPNLITFRTSRQGLTDTELQQLLDRHVGPGYQADEEDSLSKNLVSIFVLALTMGAILFIGLYVIRWMAGGSSPFSFGRSRHK